MINFNAINNVVFAVGRVSPSGIQLLGTAFMLPKPGCFATAAHVTGQDDRNLVIAFKLIESVNAFQDTSDNQIQYLPVTMEATDPIHDLCILKANHKTSSNIQFGTVDSVTVGENVALFGYPHADHGRLVLTQQITEIGARILIQSAGIKAKHAVLNIQSRPGQSGSPIFSLKDGSLIAILIGSYAPGGGGGISLGGVNPHTLHQTTHAVSALYLQEMV